jgi:hypothetical protein
MRLGIAVLVLAAFTVSAQEDSPLVALAKRSNRKASKTPVITNATVSGSKGRVSFGGGENGQTTAALPAPTIAAATAAAPNAKAQPAKAAAASAKPAYPAATAQMPASSGPASSATFKPITSTATYVAPPSSARTMPATSAVPVAGAQNTVRTVQPTSSARNIDAQVAGNPPK